MAINFLNSINMNSIITDQNSDQCIRLLKAQRVQYAKAKRIQLGFELLSIIVALSIPVFYIVLPAYKTQAGITGSLLSLLALIIDRYQKRLTKTAASIQDLFDRTLFKLKPGKFQGIENISSESILKLSKKYKKTDVKNWYSRNINGKIPHKIAVILCQKANLHWDVTLRTKYKNLIWLFVVLYFTLFLIALATNCKFTMEFIYDLLLLLAGGSAFIKYSATTINEKGDIIREKKSISLEIDKMLGNYASKKIEPKIDEIENIQNVIFSSRKKAVKVPDWFYYIFKSKQENEMDEIALAIINDKVNPNVKKE